MGVFADDRQVVLDDRADAGDLIDNFEGDAGEQLEPIHEVGDSIGGGPAIEIGPAVGGADAPEAVLDGLDPAGLVIDLVAWQWTVEFDDEHFPFGGVVGNEVPVRIMADLPTLAEADSGIGQAVFGVPGFLDQATGVFEP